MPRSARVLSCVALVVTACADPAVQIESTTSPTTSGEPSTTTGTTGTTAPASTDDGETTSTPADTTHAATSSDEGIDDHGEGAVFDVGGTPDAGEPMAVPPTDIEVAITADNAYAFGYGTEGEMSNYYGGIANLSAGDIFDCGNGPELYLVPAEDVANYLYIVSYADSAVTQGVLGQFRRLGDGGQAGDAVFTGDEGWEVCATGVDYDLPDAAPTQDVVNEQIEICNAGDSDTETPSGGWVDIDGTEYGALAVGEANDTPYAGGGGPIAGNEFPLVCAEAVDAAAHWMWFNWDPENIVWPAQTPFIYPPAVGNPMHDFMIFRLPSTVLPQPPG